MEAKFFDSLYEGDSANGVKLCMGVTGGDFWPRPAGCHIVYGGQDGDIDYDTIMAVMDISDSSVSVANQDLPPNTIWHYIRRQCSDCGLESDDSPACIIVIDPNGDMVGNTPNAPANLTIERIAGGKLRLRWRYFTAGQEIKPTGFRVYMDSGLGFDFNSPIATVMYRRAVEHSWVSDTLTHGQIYRFVVRSYADGAGEDDNYNVVSAVADSQGPVAATGLTLSWEEI